MIGPTVTFTNGSIITVSGLSNDVWRLIKSEPRSMFTTDVGSIDKHGFKADYSYLPFLCTLNVNVTSFPFYISMNSFRSSLREAIIERLRPYYPEGTVIG